MSEQEVKSNEPCPVGLALQLTWPEGTGAPLPLLVAHDGGEYEHLSGLTRLIAHAIATRRIPPCRVALLDPEDRDESYSASARYARSLAARLPQLAPASAHAGIGASLGALALLHTRWPSKGMRTIPEFAKPNGFGRYSTRAAPSAMISVRKNL